MQITCDDMSRTSLRLCTVAPFPQKKIGDGAFLQFSLRGGGGCSQHSQELACEYSRFSLLLAALRRNARRSVKN